jgi:hypothetical protein
MVVVVMVVMEPLAAAPASRTLNHCLPCGQI